jgi:Cytochrome c554 and c-prime
MALTANRGPSSKILASHPNLKFSTGPFRYAISMKNAQALYQMSSSGKKLTAFLDWAFGTGRVGQSYLFAPKDGTFREARVTYFSTLQNLDFTPARAFSSVKSPEEAMYRVVAPGEVQRCFGCHTTAAFTSESLDEQNLFPGITCEACHGPGAKHVATMQSFVLAGASPSGPLDIFNPVSLSPQDAVDFCGACHATTWDVILAGTKGVANTRSAPYRLEQSKCWGKGDARLLCWSCHNPHEQVRSDPESYDRACLNCHASSTQTKPVGVANQAPCPVATSKCVSCHMQKVYVPEMHFKFTDHRIRITQPGAPYQD